MVQLFKAADAFVLPSRGEGWGLPVMEAMAMALPTISTNWSGPTDFLSNEVGYLVPVSEMILHEDWKTTGKLAQPSVVHLKEIMREVFTKRKEAQLKGNKARQHIIKNFSKEAVAEILIQHFQRIKKILK
uniref:Glycosyl transferase family 1 domain-containing protein n=1 Tax=Arcella intermedia TaxID=1963864 RepID=A0A6B2LGN6_9EUKA